MATTCDNEDNNDGDDHDDDDDHNDEDEDEEDAACLIARRDNGSVVRSETKSKVRERKSERERK